jgi:hypothetical protein
MPSPRLVHRLLSLTGAAALILIAVRLFLRGASVDALSLMLSATSFMILAMYFSYLVVASQCAGLELQRFSPLRLKVLFGFSAALTALGIGLAALSFAH